MNNQLAAEGVSDNSHSAQLSDGKFHNTAEVERPSFKKTLGIFKRFITEKKIDARVITLHKRNNLFQIFLSQSFFYKYPSLSLT